MGYDEDDALEGIEVAFEDGQGRDVQVVRRFIQEEDVGLVHEQAQQVQAPPFAAAQLGNVGILHFFSEQELVQQARRRNALTELVGHEMAVFLDVVDDPHAFVELGQLLGKESEAHGLADSDCPFRRRQLAGRTLSSVDLPTPFSPMMPMRSCLTT